MTSDRILSHYDSVIHGHWKLKSSRFGYQFEKYLKKTTRAVCAYANADSYNWAPVMTVCCTGLVQHADENTATDHH